MISRFLLFLSVVLLGIGQIWGQTYELVTSNTQLTEGSEYIIAGTTSNNNFWIVSTTQNNNNRAAIQNGTATSMPATLEFATGYASFVLGVSGEKWSLYDANPTGTGTTNGGTANGAGGNVGYLYPVSGQNYLRTQTTLHEWTISVNNTTSVATIQTTVNNRAIKLNNNGGLFSAYTSGQRNIYLYKKGVASTDPILNTSETEITGLGYMEGNASVSQSFSLSGMNLEPANGNITVTAPTNFQVSTDDVSFNNSLNISYSGGALAATDIYVRLNGGLTLGNYNGDITISGGSANATVSVEGIVTEFSSICGFEYFENIPTASSSYANREWEGNGGTWNATNARTDQTINGKAITIQNGVLTSPEFTSGVGSITMTTKLPFSDSAGNLTVRVNGNIVGTIPYSSSVQTSTINNVNVGGNVIITVHSSGARVAIDDLEWTCYSSTPQAPVITSPLTHSSEYGAAATYTITADYLPTSFNATGLPAGLSINTSTGEISGTVTADVGNYNINISATNDEGTDTETLVWTVTPKALTATLSVENKVYDGTTTATISSSPTPTLSGIVGSDDVSLSGTPTATFDNKNTGTNKTVTISGYSLSGTKAGNYTLTTPTATANITAKSLTVSGATAQDKDYDGSNTATITGSTLEGVINPDNVTVSGGGTFASPNAGTGISVTANLTLGGADAGNYTLIQPSGLVANINKVAPEISPTIITLNVGGTYSLPGGISSDSDGNMTFSMVDNAHATLSGNIINGISIGANTLTISIAQGTNHTATTASITVNVTDFIFLDGDVRPLYDGADFSYNNAWEIYNSATNTWTTRDASLQNIKPTGRILIDKQNIGAGGNNSNTYLNDIIILSGGELFIRDVAPNYDYTTWSYFLSLNKNLTVQANGKLIVEGDIRLGTNILTIEKDGELILDNPKMRNDNGIWAGTENFMDGSFVTIKDWEWDATSSVSSLIQTGAPGISNNPNGYKFGNLIIDAELYEHWTLIGSTNYPNLPLCYGNLEIYNTSEDWFIAATSNNSSSFVVNGDLIIYDGWFNFGTTYTGNNNFINHYTINGSLINISDDNFKLHHVEAGSSTPSGSVTIKGNIEIGEDVIISNDGNKKILLETGNDEDPKFIDIASNVVRTDIDINSGYRILKKDLVLGTNSKVTVNNNSTLNFGFDTSGTNPLAIRRFNNNATQTGQSFELKNGGILKITSPDGITSGGTYTGNVQVGSSNSNRIFGRGATYHYIGKTNQSTGNGLPDGITGKLIIELETDASNENLEFTSTGTNTFGTIDGVNGILEIRKGRVIDQPNNGFRNYNGTTNENEDGESDPQKGDIIMTGGRYVVSGGGTKPSLSGSYTLTDGTVEFAGTANTKIRVKPLYHNMDVSGSNVTAGGKNLIVNNLTKVIGTGKLTIPETDDSATPYVLTARKGIQVASGATALFENNANLMQDADAVNSGDITVERFVQDMNNDMETQMDYVYWSSPVKEQSIQTFSPASQYKLWYNESNDYFYYIPSTEPNFIPAKGYAFSAENDKDDGYDETYQFIGTPQNDVITIPIKRSPDSVIDGITYEHGSNLVGNPYPSTIDAGLFYELNQDEIDFHFEFWTNESYTPEQQGSGYSNNNYAILTEAGLAPPSENQATYDFENENTIKIGQGFIVKKTAIGEPVDLVFDNSIRLPESGHFYHRNNLNNEKDRFWLTFISPNQMLNTALIGYFPNATDDFDRNFDALSPVSSDAIFTLLGEEKLGIQGLEYPLEITDEIPLGVKSHTQGVGSIYLRRAEGIFENAQTIYLRDKYEDLIHNLSEESYEFELEEGETLDRFEIIFQEDEVMNTSDLLDNPIKIYHTDQSIVIESEKEKILSVEVYDLNGRKVHSKDRINSSLYQIRKTSLATQVFVVKVLTDGGKVETRKIINQ